MPPSEQAAKVPTDNSPAMSPDMAAPAAPAAGGGGNVMITMPKAAFEAIHGLVIQLAMGLEQLKKGAEAQAGGAGPAPAAPVGPTPAGPAPAEAGEESDEDFLKGLAEEGTKR